MTFKDIKEGSLVIADSRSDFNGQTGVVSQASSKYVVILWSCGVPFTYHSEDFLVYFKMLKYKSNSLTKLLYPKEHLI